MSDDKLRIDKWLWFARVAKTRTLAQKLAVSGSVRVNRERNTSASRQIAPGDVLTIALPGGVKVLKVLDPGVRRGPATEAQTLYEDLSPPPMPRTATDGSSGQPGPRPDKRQRRQIMKLRRPDTALDDA